MADLLPTVIVSGLPRTGTTTMMRMLYYGGLPVLVDTVTQGAMNEFSPYGIYEVKDVGEKLTSNPPSWSAGKAVKLVAPYMEHLPVGTRSLLVIFMLRDMTEIISSMMAMRTIWDSPDQILAWAIRILRQHEIPTHYVQYREMVNYPRSIAQGLCNFLGPLGEGLDVTKMASAIDRTPRGRVKGVDIKAKQEPLVLFQADKVYAQDI